MKILKFSPIRSVSIKKVGNYSLDVMPTCLGEITDTLCLSKAELKRFIEVLQEVHDELLDEPNT